MKLIHKGYTLLVTPNSDDTYKLEITKIINSKLRGITIPKLFNTVTALAKILNSDLMKEDNFILLSETIKEASKED